MHNLSPLRRQIKEIDESLITLMGERMQLAHKLGKIKKETGLPIKNVQIEKKLFSHWRSVAKKNKLSPEFIEKLWTLILKESINTQKNL